MLEFMIKAWQQKIFDLYQKNESRYNVLFFVGGFIFDVLLAADIDDLFSIGQQTLYLFIIAGFIHYEILYRAQKWSPLQKQVLSLWDYRDLIMHFLLGSLLNVYSLFYIKSSSLISSIVFLALMAGLVIANELTWVKKANIGLKVGLFAICLFSYVSILFPLILGFIGWTPFGLSIAVTLGLFYLQFTILKNKIANNRTLLTALLIPSVSVLSFFTVFYILGWIPPVPLSVKKQGIYHLVEKNEGHFLLSTEKDWWKFWHSGDQDFKAQPNDKVYFYAQIYSPPRFSDQIFIQWLKYDKSRGWVKTDRIPLTIYGGRKDGFRGFASKSNYEAGQWRVQVETSMGHEVSRIGFNITLVESQPRTFTVISQ